MCNSGFLTDTQTGHRIPEYYYGDDSPEAIDVIRYVTQYLSGETAFDMGNVIKYIMRAGKKPGNNALDDLDKAAEYAYRAVNGKWRLE